MMYGVPPYKVYNNTMLETVILMPGLRSLSLSAGQERRMLREAEDCEDRVGPSSWKSRRDAGEPTSRPLPFFFLPSPSPPRRSLSFVRLPLPLRRSSPTNAAHLRFHLSFSSFSLKRRSRPCCPALRSFRIIRLSSSLTVSFYLLSASRSFLLLVASSSCSHDSLYEVASSACNYCRYVLPASPFVSFCFFSLSYNSYNLFYFIPFSLTISFESRFIINCRNCFPNFFRLSSHSTVIV